VLKLAVVRDPDTQNTTDQSTIYRATGFARLRSTRKRFKKRWRDDVPTTYHTILDAANSAHGAGILTLS